MRTIEKTGLKPKSTKFFDSIGEEIFEGDVLQTKDDFLYKVVWNEKQATFEAMPTNGKAIGLRYLNHPITLGHNKNILSVFFN